MSGQRLRINSQAHRPTPIISSDAVAKPMVECMTKGEISPATMPLALEPTNICKLDAMPRDYSTVSGLVLAELERIPATGDTLRWRGLVIEVVDMDGRRIDKLLVRHA